MEESPQAPRLFTNVAQFGPYAGMGQYHVTLTVHSSVTSPITITTNPSTTGLTSRFVFRLTGVDNFTIDGGPNWLLPLHYRRAGEQCGYHRA
jgi:hypothetical protein